MNSQSTVVFDVAGMDCADCARTVERVVARLPQVNEATVSFAAGTLSVLPAGDDDSLEELSRAVTGVIDRAGYVAAARIDGKRTVFDPAPWWHNGKILPSVLGAATWITAFVLLHAWQMETVSTLLLVLTILIGGYPIARAALASLQARRLDMNVLMSISVVGAGLLGDWSEGALVVVLFSIGTTLQALAFERTRGAIRGLLDQAPEEAIVLQRGVEVTVAAQSLIVGDEVLIRPGARLPADGVVLIGQSAVQQSAITGESIPVEKHPGDKLFAGTINGAGSLTMRVERPVSESMLANIVHLVEVAQASKAPSQQLVDRFSAVYTPVVVAAAGFVALAGWAFTNDSSTWFYRALVLLVIACPCALVISTPVSIVSAIGAATRLGVLVKGGAALEDLGRIRTVAFDKTGTLTLGRPAVKSVEPYGSHTVPEVLALAAAVERHSEHTLARAIVARAHHDNLAIVPAEQFKALVGIGATAKVADRTLAIGNDRLLDQFAIPDAQRAWADTHAERYGKMGASALTVIEVSGSNAAILGVIAVADRIRPGASVALQQLRDTGITSLVMLSGDRAAVAHSIGLDLGITDVRPEMMPDQKSVTIERLQQRGPVAMVGDGINDAPALAVADVGIAMGLAGTDVALESADIVLMRDDLGTLAAVVTLSQRTLRVIRQNVAFSMLTKVLALGLGVLGFVSLWIAVLVDVGTSLLVTFNGLRLARIIEGSLPVDSGSIAIDTSPATSLETCGCGQVNEHQHQLTHGAGHEDSAQVAD
ncbi:MAG TPA: cation-translocating P-type ATPase [Thermomicrobiales bacterium]|nr:cation-translocating P-type ATPase [Thermomicrobiales bacterium]